MIRRIVRMALAALLGLSLTAERLQSQDPLASARDLYASAQYDEALAVLNGLNASETSHETWQSIELYRTLCLLAVGREADADRVIEGIILRDPMFTPGDELSPRTRAAFAEAKKRLLPNLVQQQYSEAKSLFDRSEYEAAAVAFQRVIDALNDPDLGPGAQHPPLSDLRTLAVGFHDLSVKAIAPPPPPPPPPPAPEPAVALPPRIYTGADAGVRPPLTITQEMPRYPAVVPPGGLTGSIEIVIGETGSVESAVMVVPVSSAYDPLALEAAGKWRFQPAMLNGEAVKFRKRIQIKIAPPPA